MKPYLILVVVRVSLWKKYSETYPNGMSRSSFMLQLQNGRYKYRDDLGGLCSICADYGYSVFEDLNKVVIKYVNDSGMQVIVL